MHRREFISLLGGAAACWPLAARAQQGDRVRRIGVLIGGDEGDPERQASVAAWRKALADLGWVEGRNLHIDWRWAAADSNRARTYAAELVTLNPELIFGDNTFVMTALQQATHVIPIIFARVQDPIGSGFVGSLARPGGNLTGFADGEASVVGKLVELMREIAPHVTRVAIFASGIDTQSVQRCNASAACARAAEEAKTAASLLGLRPIFVPVQDPHEIEEAIVALAKEPNGGLIVASNPFLLLHRKLIIELAARHKLPVIYSNLNYVRDGGLMFYGVDQIEQYRGAAGYVDRILKSTKPSDLPVQLPIKYRLVVNMKTAKAIGLGVPLSILMRIDEVIE
jgi:putative ABC transport system substrate-binding protein